VYNALWNSLWICRKADCFVMLIFADLGSLVCMFDDNIYLNNLERSNFGVAYSDVIFILN
jgi:nucleosome binding factor SPN SPT16 subunit